MTSKTLPFFAVIFFLLSGQGIKADTNQIKDFRAPGSPVTAVASSYDGRWLSVAINGVISVFDALKGEVVRSWIGHNGDVRALNFNTDASLLVSGADDGSVKLWDWQTDRASLRALAHDEHVTSAAFLHEGLLLGLRDGRFYVWRENVKSAPDARRHHYGEVSIAVKQDGSAFVTGAFDQALMYFEKQDETWKSTNFSSGKRGYKAHLLMITGAVFLPPEERYLISVGWLEQTQDRFHVKVWDTETGALIREFGPASDGRGYVGLAASRTGETIALLRLHNGIEIYETSGFSKVAHIRPGEYGKATKMTFYAEGDKLAAGTSAGVVEFWSLGSESPDAVLSILGPNWMYLDNVKSKLTSGVKALDILP